MSKVTGTLGICELSLSSCDRHSCVTIFSVPNVRFLSRAVLETPARVTINFVYERHASVADLGEESEGPAPPFLGLKKKK